MANKMGPVPPAEPQRQKDDEKPVRIAGIFVVCSRCDRLGFVQMNNPHMCLCGLAYEIAGPITGAFAVRDMNPVAEEASGVGGLAVPPSGLLLPNNVRKMRS